ncbi:Alcohol dehydrogenase cytochrome c subunit precursor [compost metagenome]
MDGTGIPNQVPALKGNRLVTSGDDAALARVVIGGLTGKTSDGRAYPGDMPAFRHALTDGEIASILSFVRQSWGHQAPAVTAPSVRAARQRPSVK